MIELIRSWVIGITCAAMIVALAESLSPKGAVRKVGRLTGGLVLLLAILQPVMKIDSRDMAGILAEYRAEAAGYSVSLEAENDILVKAIIEEETGAYILDKATALGIGDCQVSVTAVSEEEGAYPIPDAVTVTGTLTEAQRYALSRQIEADLAIPAERQSYLTEDVE